jgi:hypothetical protein
MEDWFSRGYLTDATIFHPLCGGLVFILAILPMPPSLTLCVEDWFSIEAIFPKPPSLTLCVEDEFVTLCVNPGSRIILLTRFLQTVVYDYLMPNGNHPLICLAMLARVRAVNLCGILNCRHPHLLVPLHAWKF